MMEQLKGQMMMEELMLNKMVVLKLIEISPSILSGLNPLKEML
jgi:hypothetical protein